MGYDIYSDVYIINIFTFENAIENLNSNTYLDILEFLNICLNYDQVFEWKFNHIFLNLCKNWTDYNDDDNADNGDNEYFKTKINKYQSTIFFIICFNIYVSIFLIIYYVGNTG